MQKWLLFSCHLTHTSTAVCMLAVVLVCSSVSYPSSTLLAPNETATSCASLQCWQVLDNPHTLLCTELTGLGKHIVTGKSISCCCSPSQQDCLLMSKHSPDTADKVVVQHWYKQKTVSTLISSADTAVITLHAAMTRNFDAMYIPFNKDRLPAGSKAFLFTRNIAKSGAKLLSDLTSPLTPCRTHWHLYVSQTTCAYARQAQGAAYRLSQSGLQQQMPLLIHRYFLCNQVRDTDAQLILDVVVVPHQLRRSTVGTGPYDESCMQKPVKFFFFFFSCQRVATIVNAN